MNRFNKSLAATFLSAAMLVPPIVSAVTLAVYESARNDPAKQSQLFKGAYETAVAKTLVALRDKHFKDGKEKSPERIYRDKEKANRIESMVGHLTSEQLDTLVNLIAQYTQAQPNTELEDIISSFLLTEANKQLDQAPAKDKKN